MADYPPLFANADFRNWSTMPVEQIDALEVKAPGFLAKQILIVTSEIYAQLAKRYATPFNPIPEIVVGWGLAKVTVIAYKKRGVDPESSNFKSLLADAELADAQIQKAADAVDGLYELPLLESAATATDAVTKGLPQSSAQSDPYSWTDVQAASFSTSGQIVQ